MSNTTFNISTAQVESTVPLPHRDALSPESQYSNSSLSPSPDSNSSVSNLSDREANHSPDVNMLECCLSDGSFVDISYNVQDNDFCGVSLNLNQTFIVTPVDSSGNFWNENLSLSNHEMGLVKYQSFSKDTEHGSSSAVTSPDSAGRESKLSLGETFRRGCTENDCCSQSSAEMVMRSNSFCQEDQSLVVSSLEESCISLVAGHLASPAESPLLSNTLPDVLEKSTEENMNSPCLGMTFTQADLPSEENDMVAFNSLVALPSENEGGLLMTFLCESSPAGCGKESQFACAEIEPSAHFPGEFTPEQGKPFSSTPLAIQHTDMNMHTSTPVQNIGNMMPSLTSFSESPCTGNTGSAGIHPVKQQQISVTANGLVARLPPSASKVKKMEIKKFPRLNFSSVKSKVLTRNVHQRSVSSPVSLQKPSQVNNKRTEAQSRAPIKSSPANFRTSAEAEQAASSRVAEAAVLHSGKRTLCDSSSEKKPNRSGQTETKPTPKKGVLNKIEVSSALGQDKPPVLKMRARWSSDSVSLSSRQSREPSVAISKSHLGLTKLGNLNCSSLNKQDVRTGVTNVPAEISPRDVKRISLVAESSKLTTEGASSESRSRFRGLQSPRQSRGAPFSQPPAVSPRLATLSTRQWQGPQRRDEDRTSNAVGTPQSKWKSSTALATACKPASTSKGTLKRTASARLVHPTSSVPVDKSKPKASSRQQQSSQPTHRRGPPDVVPASVAEGGGKDQSILELRGLLAACNRRFQALAIVLQQTLAERDEATRQCRDLSQELVSLRGELVCSEHSSERLVKEKDELRVALQDALHKLQEQHQNDLVQLEQRLQAFYQAEWDKVHLTYQEETDKCKTLMKQQMGELKANHEAKKLELESSQAEQLLSVKQQYDLSLEEVSKVHTQELESLEKTLKEEGAALSGRIEALTVENNALIEKLTAVENRRKQMAEKNQKDSHTLYLEQELESLKVVLDIKNKQLHQQEKKLMEIGTLTEKNVKLDESYKKVQQENEDLKARMERHYALSRQLSTEQAMLQESLQKESKVNKRLSMENEELVWKLHNGDQSSPRKVSPTSPSRSFSLQSPRSSGVFSSPHVSPR